MILYNDVLALHRAHPTAVVRWSEQDATETFNIPYTWNCSGQATQRCRQTVANGTRARIFWQTPKVRTMLLLLLLLLLLVLLLLLPLLPLLLLLLLLTSLLLPKGLSVVYGWARKAGLRGVGVWITGYAPQGRDAGNVSARRGFYDALSSYSDAGPAM